MPDSSAMNNFLLVWIGLAIVLFPIQIFITAPYGRHSNKKWGPLMNNRLGWIIMEIVALLVFMYFFIKGENEKTGPMWLFFGIWTGHYFYRSIIFPIRTRTRGKVIPISVVLMALFFNIINGFTNGYYLGSLTDGYLLHWFFDIRFILGSILFSIGAYFNFRTDNILLKLRKPGETDYKIPHGSLFRYVSCPNHFGEILEWFGFALMCWNLPALAFAIWSATNLIPRSLSHHKWYKSHFKNYPKDRKAVIPYLL